MTDPIRLDERAAQPTGTVQVAGTGQPAWSYHAPDGAGYLPVERNDPMPSVSLLHSVPPPAHDEHVAAVYRYAVTNGIGDPAATAVELGLPSDVVDQAVDELVRHRLLRKDCAEP